MDKFQLSFDAISKNFNQYKELFPTLKLQFVKLIKEHTCLGLKDAKEVSDYLFSYPEKFYQLNVIEQRKKKFLKLKHKAMLETFVEEFKQMDSDKLVNAFMTIPSIDLDIFLDKLGYEGDED